MWIYEKWPAEVAYSLMWDLNHGWGLVYHIFIKFWFCHKRQEEEKSALHPDNFEPRSSAQKANTLLLDYQAPIP